MMEFPTDFSLKVVGAFESDLEAIIVSGLRENQVDVERAKISTRQSSGGKYLSYTVSFNATSQKQLDDIYRALSSNNQVLMVL